MLGCINQGIIIRDKDVILSLHSALIGLHLEHCAQFWSPLYKQDVERLERIQRRATQKIRGLEDLSFEGKLRELCVFSREGLVSIMRRERLPF